MHRTSIFALLAATILASGCAPAYKEMVSAYDTAQLCCASLKQIDYQALRVGDSTTYPITDASPLFSFSEGRSYFKAFVLPPYSAPYHLVVSSHALDDGSGPRRMYLFRPMLVTLDENFRAVRKLGADAFQVDKASFAETAKVSMSASQIRVTGRLGFTEKNRNERYLIILTEQQRLSDTLYYDSRWLGRLTVRNAPTGVVRVSLRKPDELYRDLADQAKQLEVATPGQRYRGRGFNVLAPEGTYRFFDKSFEKYGRAFSDLNFTRLQGRQLSNAFAKSYFLGSYYGGLDAAATLALTVGAALKEHEQHVDNIQQEVSPLSLAGAECRRIDFSGRMKDMLLLPTSGYDIFCIHPDWSDKTYPLVVRIGAHHVLKTETDPNRLPRELETFYQGVRFVQPE
jgi:hypothetical protein